MPLTCGGCPTPAIRVEAVSVLPKPNPWQQASCLTKKVNKTLFKKKKKKQQLSPDQCCLVVSAST